MHLQDRINQGMLFYEHGHKNPIDIEQEKDLEKERIHCKEILFDFNNTPPGKEALRQQIMKQLLGSCGEHIFFEPPVHMSYGSHVHIGNHFYANFNLILVVDGEIYIGDKVLIGPNVTLCTTGHPVYPAYRKMAALYSLPVRIGNNVWIGAHSKISFDIICVVLAFLLGGEIGIGTIIITIFLGPVIDFFHGILCLLSSTLKTSGYLSASHFGLAPDGVAKITEIPFWYSF